jgi:hypothetical protein
MTAERVYCTMLKLYPAGFRRDYGEAMVDIFREIYRNRPESRVPFWLYITADVVRTAWQQHVAARSAGVDRFVLQWLIACTAGAVVATILADVLAHDPMTLGALVGLSLAATQCAALRLRAWRSCAWMLFTTIGGAIGLKVGMALLDATGPRADFVHALALGAFIGAAQWLVLRTQVRAAGRWIVASAVAYPLGVLSEGRLAVLLNGLIASDGWAALVAGSIVMPAICGLVLGAITAKPLWSILSPR